MGFVRSSGPNRQLFEGFNLNQKLRPVDETSLPGDILIARFATHDLVERGGVRLAVLRDVTHVEGPTERPAGNTLAPAGSTSIDTSSMDRHFAEEHARLRENHRQHFDPTTEEFMESLLWAAVSSNDSRSVPICLVQM